MSITPNSNDVTVFRLLPVTHAAQGMVEMKEVSIPTPPIRLLFNTPDAAIACVQGIQAVIDTVLKTHDVVERYPLSIEKEKDFESERVVYAVRCRLGVSEAQNPAQPAIRRIGLGYP